MIDTRVQLQMTPDTTLADVEALIATARTQFGDRDELRVGVTGDNHYIVLYVQGD